MASTSALSESSLTCSICHDVFTDPVTTSCGHNFCLACIKKHRDLRSCSSCPLCARPLDSKHDFKINTTMKEIAESIKRKKTEVLCDSCPKKMRTAVKSCLNCVTSFCVIHLEPHKTAEKLMKHKLINPVKNLEDYICKKHERPLELYCRNDQTVICQFCTQSDHRNHKAVPLENESLKLLMNKKIAVQQKIQDKLQKIKEIKHSMRFNKQAKENEIEKNIQFFTDTFEKSNAELLELMEKKHKETERRGEKLIREIDEEITELKTRQTDLEKLSAPLNITQIISLLPKGTPKIPNPKDTKRSNKTSLSAHEQGSILRKTISRLQTVLDEKMKETVGRELRSIQRYAVDVTLDLDTAHPELTLTDDGKTVWNTGKSQKLPDTPKRFDVCPCVLGKEAFTSQKFYFEVQVNGADWDLGVAKESINRKGEIGLSPENGYWTIWLRKESEYSANDRVPVPLNLKVRPEKVGVFVDFEEGLVSFYDVKAMYHMYSYTGQSLAGKLHPYFSPGELEDGRSLHPLTITPVESLD